MKHFNTLEADASFDGFSSVRDLRTRFGGATEEYSEKQAEFLEKMAARRDGTLRYREWRNYVEFAFDSDIMTTLYGDTVERRMLARLKGLKPPLDPLFQKRKVAHVGNDWDIKTKQAEGVAKRLQQIAKGGDYLVHSDKAKSWTYHCNKYGGRYDFFLEDLINDDFGYFDRMPAEFADSVNNTKSYLQTTRFWDADGPLDTFFNDSEVGQMGVSSNALTKANLVTAIATMTGNGSGYRTIQGEPFMNLPRIIVVGPALELTAKEIIRSVSLDWGGYTTTLPQPTLNALAELGLRLIVDPWIPVVVTTGTIANTTWAVFSESVPAGEWADLTGHESPEIFMKSSDSVRVGGSEGGPMVGNYADDSLGYKVRMFGGCAALDPRAGWASDGQ